MALIAGVGLFVLSVLAAAVSRIVAAEIEAWSPSIIRNLIKLAVGRLPEKHRARFEEEWQSHASEVPGVVGKVLASAGFLLAAYKIALTVQRGNEVEGWLRTLEQLDCVHSRTLMVANTIRGHRGLASHEYIQSLAANLSLDLSDSRELRSRLAEQVSAYSDAPRSVVSNVLSLRRRRLAGLFDHLSRAIEQNRELTDQVMTELALLEGDQKEDSPRKAWDSHLS